MIIENYKVFDFVTFQLLSNSKNIHPFNKNFEYEYFKSDESRDPSFIIHTGFPLPAINIKGKFQISENKLVIQDDFAGNPGIVSLQDIYSNQTNLHSYIKYSGYRKYFGAFASKNLFVRPLLSLHLLKNEATLLHAGGISIKGNSIILAGRPGVFKTSIIMDAIRKEKAKYYGDENVLIKDDSIYPFPLNIRSFFFKLKHYKNENASHKFQKMSLWNYLLLNRPFDSEIVSTPDKVNVLFYLEKGVEFRIDEIDKFEACKLLLNNELSELNLAPTHTLSGIKYNNFYDFLKFWDETHPGDFNSEFEVKFNHTIKGMLNSIKLFKVTVTNDYSEKYLCKILEKIEAK